MFLINAKISNRNITSEINLKDQLKSTHNIGNIVKKAIKSGFIKEVDIFQKFWNDFLIQTLKKKYDENPVHNSKEITLLHKRFPSNIRQFNTYLNGVILAGAIIF